jgi:hypothetical protein
LNDHSVDIGETPLGSFDDEVEGGEVEGEGEEIEEGDEDVEEIEEGVFDASQGKKRPRTVNYTEIEDTCLVRAWEQVSLDAVAGTDQTGKRYWQRIEDKFFQLMPRVANLTPRTYRSLQGRWDVIKACYSRWSASMEQVRNAPPSGVSIDEYVSSLYFVHLKKL